MTAPAILRLRDPRSYSYRGLRTPLGAALRGGAVNTEPLVCTVLTLTAASADVDLTSAAADVVLAAGGAVMDLDAATADVMLSAARAAVDITECD